MNTIIKVLEFSDLTNSELYEIISLRERVFVVEQNCPYLDCDGKDLLSKHLCLYNEAQLVAYARLVPPDETYQAWSVGRVVVAPEFRGVNLGKQLMRAAIDHLEKTVHTDKIVISAQQYLLRFYNELGFKEEGAGYLEDDIPHVKMVYRVVK